MRKKRSQYKVCGRLGYNATLRRWTGHKKKWQTRGRFTSPSVKNGEESTRLEKKKVVNPVVSFTNEERRGGGPKAYPVKKRSRMRRKDAHGRVQSQKTGRKRRYGGVKRKAIQKSLKEERKTYKQFKSRSERSYRKGRRRESVNGGSRSKASHRRSRTEVRVDVRRWRSARVSTLQMARDLVEHGHVYHVDAKGTVGKAVKWQGGRVEVGEGRKIDEGVWKAIRANSVKRREQEEYGRSAVSYVEVDYLTGRRILRRKPESTEVVLPKGMELSGWTWF
jgi:hypothetical protein